MRRSADVVTRMLLSLSDMKKEEPILVAIHCLVYNHEPYLRDCFEGLRSYN